MVSSALEHLGYTKVTQLDVVVGRQKYILRLKISVKNFSRVNILKRETKLHEPIHDFGLSKFLIFAFLLADVICKVTVLAKLHDNDEDTLLDERVLVGHNVGMSELLQ